MNRFKNNGVYVISSFFLILYLVASLITVFYLRRENIKIEYTPHLCTVSNRKRLFENVTRCSQRSFRTKL